MAQDYGVSDDGNYVFAEYYSKNQGNNLVAIRSTSGSWYTEVTNVNSLKFSVDSKSLLYMQKGNLYILKLGSNCLDSILSVERYEVVNGKQQFLIFSQNEGSKLNIKNLNTKQSFSFSEVESYFTHPTQPILFIKRLRQISGSNAQELLQVNIESMKTKLIWTSKEETIGLFTFSESGKHLAFFTSTRRNTSKIWGHLIDREKAYELINDSNNIFSPGYRLNSSKLLQFVPNGNRLLFYVISDRKIPENPYRRDIEELVSYLDPKPNYYWRSDIKRKLNQLVSMDLKKRIPVFIEQENDLAIGSPFYKDGGKVTVVSNDFALTCHFEKEVLLYNERGSISIAYTMNEYNFNKYVSPNIYLVNLSDGRRRLIKKNAQVKSNSLPFYEFDPTGKVIVYYDSEHYYSYDINTGISKKISSGIESKFIVGDRSSKQVSGLQSTYYNLVGGLQPHFWLIDDPSILIQDSYSDIWKLSLNGKTPVCVTNGQAKKLGFTFVLQQPHNKRYVLYNGDQILISALFSKFSKYSGIYQLTISNPSKLKILISPGIDQDVSFKKAKNSETYVWKTFNTMEPPTVSWGNEFEKRRIIVKKVRHYDPVKQEILIWKDSTGEEHEGVILFPKDFNPDKKYPTLITYYSSISPVLGGTKYLDYSEYKTEVDLGYILFVPEIKFVVGVTGASVTNAVISGANELMKRSYINSKRIGILGGSFAGYQTNYIIGSTNIFAAAYSVAGNSNFTSSIGLEHMDSEQRINSTATINGQGNMGITLWQRPDLYLANSPVFYADKVSCPVLLSHGRQDFRVPFQQGMEFYKALQANGKKVWLDATNSGHAGAGVGSVMSSKRAQQFFGHYLKDEPAPYWMTRPSLELLEKGLNPYDYDPEIKTPSEGIIPKEKSYAPQVEELLRHRTTIDKNGRIVDVKSN
ncbi:alpha/beta hydrolase family protein [Pedobacter chinensis]|nr:prolyl oligopeptidase family serine peptidase [Pedobacter chinensis]